MKNLWQDSEASQYADDPLGMRVYTSRLLGKEPDLVLHGGGNTSVKATAKDVFGHEESVLYVKGSGWDLSTIEAEGFAPVKLDVLQNMACLDCLSDSDMVKAQRAAMTEPGAPNPSVEAILHAIIPFRFVDHTHADAVVTVTNNDRGEERIHDIYGDRVLVIPYVMPGFILSKKVYEMTRDIDWSQIEGMILMHHGIFTFADDARDSYENMIRLVSEAETYLENHVGTLPIEAEAAEEDLLGLARLRRAVSITRGCPVIATSNVEPSAVHFSLLEDIESIATRGPLTPDHIIRTKRSPVLARGDADNDVRHFAEDYVAFFDRHKKKGLTCLDAAPRWCVWPGRGTIAFGTTHKEATIIADISEHTVKAIQQAEALGGWKALPETDLFDMEYWELEQAKLKKSGAAPSLRGRIALVTGAASGIGKACVEALRAQGAVVAALDIDPAIEKLFDDASVKGVACDVTDSSTLKHAVDDVVRTYGGLDIVISNAGTFPANSTIAEMKSETWDKSIAVNLSSHRALLQHSIPYLSVGMDPAVVMIASKNVPAPGPGASAYSVAKAGMTQLARVAALELSTQGIRVNVLHPNAVFDTALWTDEVLAQRSAHYGMSVEEYKTNNLLKVEVRSSDVANLACAMAGPLFAKTTGAQLPVDGGNERVI